MRILLIGGTGLVGSLLADRLLARGHVVEVLLRRPSPRGAANWREHVAPTAEWPGIASSLAAEAAVSALGTTMRAAGSQESFRDVDFAMVRDFAEAAREAGVRHMLTVSSVGADARSANFYLRTKGEMEAALGAMGFDRLNILRPGLLRGPRGGDRRLGERIGILASPVANLFLRGRLDCYAAIDARMVAAAAEQCVSDTRPGRFIHHNRDISDLAAA